MRKVLYLVFLVPFQLICLFSETVQHQVSFNRSDLTMVNEGEYKKIDITGIISIGEVGFPQLPVKPVSILLPPNSKIEGIRIISVESEDIEGNHTVYPAQSPTTPGESFIFSPPNQLIYNSNQRFPSEPVQLTNHGSMSGYSIANILIYPVQYIPSEGLLIFHKNIKFDIDYVQVTDTIVHPERRYEKSQRYINGMVDQMIHNRHDLLIYKPSIKIEQIPSSTVLDTPVFSPELFPSIEGSAVDYLIVTNEQMLPPFEQFANWKTKRGTPAVVKTMSDIKSFTKNGVDDAETLRSFIKEAYQKWGVTWVLLGGDESVIPVRYVDIESNEKTAISDYYYSDLDGNWNGDGDAIWGERLSDQVDCYPDVFVGRAPVESLQEAESFISKTIAYQQGEGDHYNKILYLGENLGSTPGDGMYYCEIMDKHVSQSWIQKTKLYEINGNQNRQTTLSAMNDGQNIIFNVSHGNAYRILAGPPGEAIEYSDMSTITNTNRYSILYSVTCNTNDISFNDCFAEHFILNPVGGGVGYIGSTWLDYPSVSRTQNEEFFRLLFEDDYHKLGDLFVRSKLPIIPFASFIHYRQALFTYLLLGDPELDIFIRVPSNLSVQIPLSIPIGSSEITVSVTDSVGQENHAVEKALVCLEKKQEIYTTGYTNSSGEKTFFINPHTEGSLSVSVSKYLYTPYTGQIEVTSSDEPHAYCRDFYIHEIDGNGDGTINPGERIRLTTIIANTGNREIEGNEQSPIRIMLNNRSPYITLVSDTFDITTPIQSSQEAKAQFEISLDPFSPDETKIPIPVTINHLNDIWQDTLIILIRSPDIQQLFTRSRVFNHKYICKLTLRNGGTGYARNVVARLTTEKGIIVYENNTYDYGNFLPGQVKTGDFLFRVENQEPDPAFLLTLSDSYGKTWEYLFDFKAPDKLEGLRFNAEKNSIILVWEPNIEENIAGYYIFRSEQRSGSYQRINRLAIHGSSTYRDSGLEPNQMYYYRVSVIDSTGNESPLSYPIKAWTQKGIAQGWPIRVNSLVWAGPTVADVDGDKDMEIFISGTNGSLYAFHHDGLELINPNGNPGFLQEFVQVGASIWSSPAIGDLDRDGVYEVVVTPRGSKTGVAVYSWHIQDKNLDGIPDLVSGWPTPFNTTTAILASPVIANVDKDKELEVITMDQGGFVYVLEHNGTLKEGWPKEVSSGKKRGQLYSTVAVGNLDDDLESEIIACGGNHSTASGTVYIWGNSSLDSALVFEGSGPFSASPILADLDNDGNLEIVAVSEQHRIYVLESNGDYMDGWEDGKSVEVMNIRNQNRVTPSPAVGDLNKDGELEIVVPGLHSIEAWHADGSIVSGFPKKDIVTPASPIIADVDGLNDTEIIVGTGDKKLYAIKSNGTLAEGFPISVGGPIMASAVVSDIDGDGLNEILWTSDDLNIYMVRTDGIFPFIEWGGFHNDMANTGLYIHPPDSPLANKNDSPPTLKPETFVLYQNYPNPFNPMTNIRYYIPDHSFVTITIYDLLGRKVRTLVNRVHQPGFGSVLWDSKNDDGKSVSAGLYIISLSAQGKAQNFIQSRKMLLMK